MILHMNFSLDKSELQNKDNFHHFLYMAQVVEARDPYTAGHLWRVAQFSKALGKQMEIEGDELFDITLGAYLHDFGKIIVPDHVLNKTGSLNDSEKKIMDSHAEAGFKMLLNNEFTKKISYFAKYHHESWNGKGYPSSLLEEGIPRGARLVCIADSFDAMTSNRPYRKSMSLGNAMELIREQRGIQFDPEIVDEFLQMDEQVLLHIIGHSDVNKKLLTCKQCGPVIEKPDSNINSAFCRVCTGKFDVHHSQDGTAEVEFNGDHGDAIELLSNPDMRHVESNFAEFGV